jgi:lysophospholipase L1-like esterase
LKNILINVGLFLGSTLLFLGGLEFVLRLTGIVSVGPHPPLIYQVSSNPAISYELIPSIEQKAYRSIVKTNTLGFRSNEIDPSRPLVAVLGDSITFGYGVENDQTIAAQLEKQLPQFQFLNAGVPGYHLGQETALYKEKIAPINPEAVILIFYPNDMGGTTGWLDRDNVLRAADDDPSDRPALRCNPPETGILSMIPGKCWLDHHSAMYVAVKKFVSMRTGNEILLEDQQRSREMPEEDSIASKHIRMYERQLKALASELSPTIKRIFAIWPDREVHTISRPKIRALAEKYGFTVIDLYDTFGNEAKTLSWDTVHPHPATIEKAAEVIAQNMQ